MTNRRQVFGLLLGGMLTFSATVTPAWAAQYNYIINDPLAGATLTAGVDHDFWVPWIGPSGIGGASETGYFSISNNGLVMGSFHANLGLGPNWTASKWAFEGDFRVSLFFETSPYTGGYGNRLQAFIFEMAAPCGALVWPSGYGGIWMGYAPPPATNYYPLSYSEAAYFLFVKAGNTLTIYKGDINGVSESDTQVFFGNYFNPAGQFLFGMGTGGPNSGWLRAKDVVIETEGLVACDGTTAIPDKWLATASVVNDHFLSYKIKRTKGAPEWVSREVLLKDQFLEGVFVVEEPKELLNPADKNDEGIGDFDTHLLSYEVEEQEELGDFQLQDILVENQFGALTVDVGNPKRLLVPASMSRSDPLPPPDPNSHNVDHFLCYEIENDDDDESHDGNDEADAPALQVLVQDEFNPDARLFDIKQPEWLCNPVDKNGEGIKNPDNHLICYRAKPSKGELKHEKINGLFINNQFGQSQVDTKKETNLCVPSTETLSEPGGIP